MSGEETDIIIDYRKKHEEFRSVSDLYLVEGLSQESLSKLLFPHIRIDSQNELEDSEIPLSISLVDAVERRIWAMVGKLEEEGARVMTGFF